MTMKFLNDGENITNCDDKFELFYDDFIAQTDTGEFIRTTFTEPFESFLRETAKFFYYRGMDQKN